MIERDKSLKHSVVVCFTIMILFSFTEPSHCEQQPVQIGQWTIKGHSFNLEDDPGWSGTASTDNNSQISIRIYKDPDRILSIDGTERNKKVINLDGIGEAVFSTDETGSAQQRTLPAFDVPLGHSLSCIFNQHRFIFERSETYSREPTSLEPRKQFVQESIQKVFEEASSDPLVSFAKMFFSKEVRLDRNLTSNTIPVVEASIDNSEFIELKTSQSQKGRYRNNGYNFGWILPAQPGQNVKFRIQLDSYEMIASTYGITTMSGSEFSQGRKISIDDKESMFDNSGIAELDYGNIKTPEWLCLNYPGWKTSYTTFRGYLYLRWGRHEEEWLDTNDFPLAEKVTNPTLDACIKNLLHDLNIAYDWDKNCWIPYRGQQITTYDPDYTDSCALESSVLDEFPQLSAISQEKTVDKWLKHQFGNIFWKSPYKEIGEVTINDVNLVQESLVKLNLDNKMTSYFDDGPSGWHHPYEVFMLAYLWQEFPELREKNPIEKIFDFWVEAMKDNPDPVGDGGKAGAVIDGRLYSRAYAIAALNLGYELFKKPEYKEACDVQVNKFRESLQEKGFLDSIINMDVWKDKTLGFSSEGDRQMTEAVSLYGQVCVLIGDKEGLKQAQDWIKTALTREGTILKNAFCNYEYATFKDRCSFIAILRGKSIFSELPLTRDVLLD